MNLLGLIFPAAFVIGISLVAFGVGKAFYLRSNREKVDTNALTHGKSTAQHQYIDAACYLMGGLGTVLICAGAYGSIYGS